MIVNPKLVNNDKQPHNEKLAPADTQLQSAFEQQMEQASFREKEKLTRDKLNSEQALAAETRKSQKRATGKHAAPKSDSSQDASKTIEPQDESKLVTPEVKTAQFDLSEEQNSKAKGSNAVIPPNSDLTSQDSLNESNYTDTRLTQTAHDSEEPTEQLKQQITSATIGEKTAKEALKQPNDPLAQMTNKAIETRSNREATPQEHQSKQQLNGDILLGQKAHLKESVSVHELKQLTEKQIKSQPSEDTSAQLRTNNTPGQLIHVQPNNLSLGDRILEQMDRRTMDSEQLQNLLNRLVSGVESLKQQGLSQSKMQLQLPQLGQMELALTKTDNTLQVIILSQPGAQQLMQAARAELFERLQQEFPDQELELSFNDEQGDSEQGSRNQRFIYEELEENR